MSKPIIADKAALRRILEAQDEQTGFVVDATATPQKVRELMIAQVFARRIMRSRGR